MISQQGLGRRGGGGNPGSSTCGSWGQPCPRVWHGVTPLQGLNPPRDPHLRGVTPSPPPPSLCGFAGTNRTGEPPPPPQGHGASAFWGLREGCSRCRGGQGTRVPVSQLRPNHQLPQSSCRFVWICPPPKKKTPHWEPPQGFVPPVALHCPQPLVVPSCPGGRCFLPQPRLGPMGLVSAVGADKEELEETGTQPGKGQATARTGTGPCWGRGPRHGGWEPGHWGMARHGDIVPEDGDKGCGG